MATKEDERIIGSQEVDSECESGSILSVRNPLSFFNRRLQNNENE